MPDIKEDNNLDDFFDKDANSSDFQDDLELGEEKEAENLQSDNDSRDDNNDYSNSDDNTENDFDQDKKEESISEHDDEIEKSQEPAEEEWSDTGDTADDEIGKEQENSEEQDDEIEKDEQDKNQEYAKDESVNIAKSKIILAKKLLSNIKENNDRLLEIFSGMVDSKDEDLISIGQVADDDFSSGESKSGEGKIIEGVFDGENMIGPDGKQYSVPANYASKSKMVEGDILKLTITGKGTFIYKQISPIERIRIIGVLERNSDNSYSIIADNRKWRVLTASVTYFKGESGDEAVAIIPKTGESKWAAVENVVKKSENGRI